MADDLLQGLQDAVGQSSPEGGEGGQDPKATIDQFMKALDNMEGLSDEDKKKLANNLLGGGLGGLAGGAKPPVGNLANPWLEVLILFGLVSLIILILGYIGYSLYHNTMERERKKEQKRLQKEQKKKK